DGRMALCCYDVLGEEGLGDANVTPLRELWQGQRLREIRTLLSQGKAAALPLCRNCAMGRKYPVDWLRR
ncbi:MAG: SPASM domain-containing protein, partial [Armatimonadia bacterium]